MIARARAQSQDIEILVGLFGLARQANPVFGGGSASWRWRNGARECMPNEREV